MPKRCSKNPAMQINFNYRIKIIFDMNVPIVNNKLTSINCLNK